MKQDVAPFTGFPPASQDFLAALADNNTREWFEAHKADYQTCLLEPARAFTVALGEQLAARYPGIVYDPRTSGSGSIMRIYRDVRFSKDKSPYKTNLGIVFWQGQGKKTESPGFYFHMEAGFAGMFAGVYAFTAPMLAAYREAVADDAQGAALVAALDAVRQHGEYTIGGQHYKRVPRGYDPAHERADLLRHNGLTLAAPPLDPALLATPALIDRCLEQCKQMAPVQQWLVQVAARQQVAA